MTAILDTVHPVLASFIRASVASGLGAVKPKKVKALKLVAKQEPATA